VGDLLEFLVDFMWNGAAVGESDSEPEDPKKRRRGRLVRLGLLVLILAALSSPFWLAGLTD
jgi:hypothetical protein